ncbi:MAG: oxidoreductase [Bacteroidota bacterium]|nr:oxidoreductase [Bacteroidota bacterium]
MKKKGWAMDHIPPQEGRIAVVTGASSGLGYHTARALAMKGARVIMACRNLEKGEMARQEISKAGVSVEPVVWYLNLASLASVKQFALQFSASGYRLDLLINNAGLMLVPYRKTEDGFEMHFGVNHLGHFALTALLWPQLTATEGSRVVQVSSLVHHLGKMRFEDIHWEKGYLRWGAYSMSKLANLLFIHELTRRLKETGGGVITAAAHPGYTDSELLTRINGKHLRASFFKLTNRLVAQTGEQGALPSLYAATAPGVEQGAYFGPGGFFKLRGRPVSDSPSKKLLNDEVAGKLWDVSESLCGLEFRV